MTIETNASNRKVLAQAISEEIGEPMRYLGVPSCAYQVGPYIVDRNAAINGEDFGPLREFLLRHGYIHESTPADQPEAAGPEPHGDTEPAAQIDSGAEGSDALVDSEAITEMEISVPARGITPTQLKNLVFTLYSRQALIRRMTQCDALYIPDCLIEELRENTPPTPEEFTRLLDDCIPDGLAGFDFRDGKITMVFSFDEAQPDQWTAYANLLNRIIDAATKATRVSPELVEPDEQNEKYLAHVWLQRLGYGGPDFKAERKILLGHLKGYAAFSNADKMQAHKERYAVKRHETEASQAQVQVETPAAPAEPDT